MLGYLEPEQFTFADWVKFRNVNRVQYHLFKALGATYYSAHDPKNGGEFWHYQPGTRLYAPDGRVIYASATDANYPNSGVPGHELQFNGPNGVAACGGSDGHVLARRDHGLVG